MKVDRQRLIFGLFLLVLIAAAQLIAGHLGVPAWPAFMAMIFFFLGDMDVKKIPHILLGGVAGIAAILLFTPVIGALAPVMGVEVAALALVLVLLSGIVVFGEMAPMVFNNYAFMYLTVTGIAVQQPNPNPFLWMAMAAIGGAVLIGAAIGIVKIMTAMAGLNRATSG